MGKEHRKSACLAYLLWLFGGYLGLHHVYLRRYRQALVWWCLPGGYFGAGWVRDLWRIPEYVRDANDDDAFVREWKDRVRRSPTRPGFSFARAVAELFVGNIFGALVSIAAPSEKDLGLGVDLAVVAKVLYPLAVAVGIWLVGNIGREKGSLWPTALACYLMYPAYHEGYVNSAVVCAAGIAVFNFYSKRWETQQAKRDRDAVPAWKNILIITLCGGIYTSMWFSYVYFNMRIVTVEGDEIYVRDAMKNFITSPAFKEFTRNLGALWRHALEFGFVSTFQQLIESLDPLGEQNALEVLELERGASQEQIRARYRELTKKWHPDRIKDPEEKAEAQKIFVEIQQAYERLSDIKTRRARRNKVSQENPGEKEKL